LKDVATQGHVRESELRLQKEIKELEIQKGFAVSVPGLPGCHSQGLTEDEALKNIADAI